MTNFIPASDIVVPKRRQRKEFKPGELNELRESIEKHGLWHPPVCRRLDGETVLVSGERRLRAVLDLYELGGVLTFGAGENAEGAVVRGTAPYGTIPFLDIGELSLIEALEAELEENIRRVDLTWQERAQATANLADLRTAQALERGLPPPKEADIAREIKGGLAHLSDGELGDYQANVRKDIILAQHLDKPAVAGAKTAKEAFKILQRQEETEKNVALGLALGADTVASGHTLVQQDTLVWLAGQVDAQFDVILTDPPYGMGADEFGESGLVGTMGAHFYEDAAENFERLMSAVVPETFRITKPEAHLYVFCDLDKFHRLRTWFTTAGWRVFRTPLIWFSPGKFRAPWPEHGPQRKYECILFAVKGDRRVNKVSGDVLLFNPEANLGHQAQKPVALFEELLKRSIKPGDQVVDLFCGTGTIFPAAQAVKCFATGVEQDAAACGIAATRLAKLKGTT